jgi:hypothetical protein
MKHSELGIASVIIIILEIILYYGVLTGSINWEPPEPYSRVLGFLILLGLPLTSLLLGIEGLYKKTEE